MRRAAAMLVLWGAIARAGGFEIPAAHGWINDFAELLSGDEAARLADLSDALEKQAGAELVVVTVRTTQGTPSKEAAHAILNRWGVGKRDKNNGLVLLLAVDDRRLELAVGKGIEDVFPESEVVRLLQEKAVPLLRQGRPGAALEAVVRPCVARLRAHAGGGAPSAEAGEPSEDRPAPAPTRGSGAVVWAILGGVGLALGAGVWFLIRLASAPEPCPRCGKGLAVAEKTIEPATHEKAGRAEKTSSCAGCGYLQTAAVLLPLLVESSSLDDSSSYSSDSSSSDSFGGGSSDGGGGGTSW